MSKDDLQTIAAGMRRQIEDAAAVSRLSQALLNERLAKLDKDVADLLKTKTERRAAKLAEFGKTWGPTIAGILLA